MTKELNLKETKKEWHGSLTTYVIGFIGSLLLTLVSFGLVTFQAASPSALIYTIAFLALIQAMIQLLFFLHVGQEAKPRWESLVFYFMVLILVIIVAGSLWIMNDLDYRVMSGMNMEMQQ